MGGSRILVRGAQWRFDPREGALSSKFAQNTGAWKLHDFEKSWGQGPPLDPLVVHRTNFLFNWKTFICSPIECAALSRKMSENNYNFFQAIKSASPMFLQIMTLGAGLMCLPVSGVFYLFFFFFCFLLDLFSHVVFGVFKRIKAAFAWKYQPTDQQRKPIIIWWGALKYPAGRSTFPFIYFEVHKYGRCQKKQAKLSKRCFSSRDEFAFSPL